MSTIYNRIPPADELVNINITLRTDRVAGGGVWAPLNSDNSRITVGRDSGKSMTMSVLEEWCKEQDLESKYPALAAAQEHYNIIKAICQEPDDELR